MKTIPSQLVSEIELTTVWKIMKFYITQILREMNFGDSRSAKLAIAAHLEALKFGFYDFLHFLRAEKYQTN